MSNMDGQMMPKWTQMKTWIPWELWMDKWCQNEHKWTQMKTWILMSNMDGQMMPKWTQTKTWIPGAIWMDKWYQNKLKWRLESHEQYGWTNDAKMISSEDLNPMSNMDGQMMPKWTEMKTWIPWAIWMVKWCQNELKWTQMKTWIPWALWREKWCQNELKWRLEYHEQYGWTNDAKWTQMKTWISWAIWLDKWCQNELKLKSRIPWAIWMDKWCQNELKWRLESHEQYGWPNDAKMNSNEDLNPMSNMDGQMMTKWLKWRLESHEHYWWTNDAKMNLNEDLNTMSNMDGQMMPNELKWRLESHENMDAQMMPKWTEMKTWIPWAIWMVKWWQNELKWRLESHEHYWWTNDAKMNSNELKRRLESHEQYGWTNDAKMNLNEDLNTMSNMDGQMMPKWTQMKTWIPWAIWMDKWCQNELKWRLESHEQYGWTNDAKMNSNEDLNPMRTIDGQMMPKWTQMKTWIPGAIWMDKWCQNKLKWRLESHEQCGWINDAKWTQMKTWIPWAIWMDKWCQNKLKWSLESHEQCGWP